MQTTIYYIYKPYPHYMHITINIHINIYPHIPILHLYPIFFINNNNDIPVCKNIGKKCI